MSPGPYSIVLWELRLRNCIRLSCSEKKNTYMFFLYRYEMIAIKNWLMWLWRLWSSRSAGGKLESQWRNNGIILIWVQRPEDHKSECYTFRSKSESKAGENQCPISKMVRQKENSYLLRLLIPFRSSVKRSQPTHFGGGKAHTQKGCLTKYLVS